MITVSLILQTKAPEKSNQDFSGASYLSGSMPTFSVNDWIDYHESLMNLFSHGLKVSEAGAGTGSPTTSQTVAFENFTRWINPIYHCRNRTYALMVPQYLPTEDP